MCRNEMMTRKKLMEELKAYNGILSDFIMKYLTSLINLEFSAIRGENITEAQRKILSGIDIYKDIAIYNICARANKIFYSQRESGNFVSSNFPNEVSYGIKLSGNYKFGPTTNLFWYKNAETPCEYKTVQIGKIYLFQTIWSEEKRILEMDRISKEIIELHKEYEACDRQYRKKYIIPSSIKKYESILSELTNRHHPSETQEKIMEITSRIHNLFMDDYGLSENDFEEIHPEIKCSLTGDEFMQKYKQTSEMEKVLVKKYPNLVIERNVTYL